MDVREVPVAGVKVRGMRLRSEHDVASLASSIAVEGLHSPILVDEGMWLIDGLHRIKAFGLLGIETIPAHVKEATEADALLAEVTANLERHELNPVERAEHVLLKERLLAARGERKTQRGAGRKRGEIVSPLFEDGRNGAGQMGNAEIAAAANLSTRAIQYDKRIARQLPDPIRRLVKTLPELEGLRNSQRELRRLCALNIMEQARVVSVIAGGEAKTVRDALRSMARQGTRLLAEAAPASAGAGPADYRTIVVDPPWSGADSGDDDPFGKLAPAYHTMTLEEIADLPVGERAREDDCHLYLWVTGRMMHHGPRIMEGWGFRYIQPLHWIKNRIGTGRYFRNSAELCLFGIRGSRVLAVADQPNVFYGDRGRHSAKPKEFYEMVRRCSPGPRLELFAREANEGFDAEGAEIRPSFAGVRVARQARGRRRGGGTG